MQGREALSGNGERLSAFCRRVLSECHGRTLLDLSLPSLDWCRVRGQHFGCRVLLLGESHYGEQLPEDESGFTRDIVVRLALSRKPHPFFSKIGRLVGGVPLKTEEGRKTFWNSVAFYNYVQELAGTGPRQRPTDAMWEAGGVPFAEVLERLRPHCLLIFGKQLAYRMTKPRALFTLGRLDGEEVKARAQLLQDGTEVVGLTVTHPSSGQFKYAHWNPRVKMLLEHARRSATRVQ